MNPPIEINQAAPLDIVLNVSGGSLNPATCKARAEFRESLAGPAAGTLRSEDGSITVTLSAITLHLAYDWLRRLDVAALRQGGKGGGPVLLSTTVIVDDGMVAFAEPLSINLTLSNTRGAL